MSEEYYEEEYDDNSYEQYADAFCEGYNDGLEEGLDDIEGYEDAENDCIDNVDYEQDWQDDHLGSKSLNNHHPHVAHTMLGMAMGYAAAKTVRGNTRKRSLKENLICYLTWNVNLFIGKCKKKCKAKISKTDFGDFYSSS